MRGLHSEARNSHDSA